MPGAMPSRILLNIQNCPLMTGFGRDRDGLTLVATVALTMIMPMMLASLVSSGINAAAERLVDQ